MSAPRSSTDPPLAAAVPRPGRAPRPANVPGPLPRPIWSASAPRRAGCGSSRGRASCARRPHRSRQLPSACAAAPPQLPLLAVAARPSRSPEQARPRRRVQVQLVPADAALGPLALDEQYVSNCVRRRPAPSLPARVTRPSSPCPPPCSTHTPLPRLHPRPPAAARARARPPARVLARAGPPVGPGGAAERRAVRRVQVQLATDTARPR